MHTPRWGMFYDFHTMPAQPDVGASFDVERATDTWKANGIDYVVFHARCNLGMAYYDTRIGTRHPSLEYDLFGKLAQSCRLKGIALTAYLNVGLSHEEALLHRDWCKLSPEGYTYLPDRMDHFMRRMCYNTAYADHLLAMITEIARGYPVSGFFLDCMHSSACVGVECVREMKTLGMDIRDRAQMEVFGRLSQVRMARRIRDTVRAVGEDYLLYFNGVEFEDQLDLATYLELECLPTGGWGYETLPVYSRYLRTLGKPVLNMTGRFHRSWADFGGIRTEPSLEYDVIAGLSNGLRPTIGDHWHPRGDQNDAVAELVGRVYGRARVMEPLLEGAVAPADVAVLTHAPPFGDATLGAVRMLSELKVQHDVITPRSAARPYALLVLPDTIRLDEALSHRVRAHLDGGGALLSTGWSGLTPEGDTFALPHWGLEIVGEDPAPTPGDLPETNLHLAPYPAYFRVGPALADGLPDMPLNCYVRGIIARTVGDTEIHAHAMSSYFPQHWDGEHHHLYIPPERVTERPMVTQRGALAHVTHPIFTSYYQYAPVPLKQLVANLLARVHPRPLVRTGGLPSFARVTVTSQPGRAMVWVLGYVPERRGAAVDMIEEPIHLHDLAISLRDPGHGVVRVRREPGGEVLAHGHRDGYTTITVGDVPGWCVLVFEGWAG